MVEGVQQQPVLVGTFFTGHCGPTFKLILNSVAWPCWPRSILCLAQPL